MSRKNPSVTYPAEYKELFQKYAAAVNRTLPEFFTEAALQMINRYRKDKLNTIEKRIEDLKKDLENLSDETSG